MIKRLSYILILFLTINGASAQLSSETFGQLSVNDGLSSSVVTCIMKDSRGFMWFGTQQGLNRYDGYNFKKYFYNDTLSYSPSGNFILSMAEDSEGNLWIGTEGNGLNRYNRKTDNFTRFVNNPDNDASLSDNTVRALLFDQNGSLLVGTDRGVDRLNPENNTFEQIELKTRNADFTGVSVYTLYLDMDGTLWIGTDKGLLHSDAKGSIVSHFEHQPKNKRSLSNNTINQVLRLSDGTLVIATNEGLNVFNDSLQTFTRYFYNPEVTENREKSEIQAIVEDNRGYIWIGSFGGGLLKTKPGTDRSEFFLSNADNPESISSDYINALYFDDAGIIWIGTYGGGISKIDQVRIRFESIHHESGNENTPLGNEVYAIHTNEKYLFLGTEKGLSIRDQSTGRYYHYNASSSQNKSISGSTVYSIEEDHLGNIWVGTAGKGLNKMVPIDGGTKPYKVDTEYKVTTGHHSLIGNEIFCLLESSDSTLWVGTNKGINLIKNEKIIAGYEYKPDDQNTIPDDEVYSLYEDQNHEIWIGTYQGLCRFEKSDSIFLRFDAIESLSNSTIYTILQDSAGIFWLGTDNAGLIRFEPENNDQIKIYKRENGLPDNVIYGILEDQEGNLWMSSNKGIFKLMKQMGSDKVTFHTYNASNWLHTDDFNIGAYHEGKDGMLYFGSFDGLTFFLPENVKGNDYAPPVQITGFELFFKPVSISNDGSTVLSSSISETEKIELKHNQNVLKFEFAALNFIEPEKNMYAFMMENLENDWNYARGQREAQYLYLPPGKYRFRVKAANNDGKWNNKGTAIDIIIKPPFSQTIWFYIILIGGLALMIWWVMHLRTRRLKVIRDRLEEQVQKRTFELRESNKNLQGEIKERLKVEEALKKSEARFRQLIDTMNEGFSVQDKDGKINYVNPRLCEMFGYKASEIIGRYPTDFVDRTDPQNLKKFAENRDIGIQNGTVASYELKWQRKDGSIFETVVSPKPIIDPQEGYTGSVAVLTDITDLKNAEKELRSKNKALNSALDDLRKTQAQLIDSEKMASLGQLTAGVAHEINNPINFVSGNVQPLRRDIQDVLDVLHQYDRIIEALHLEDKFEKIDQLKQEIDFDFVLSEISHLLDGIGEGAQRTTEIVKGLRNFSRMDEHELKSASINQGIESTLLILHNKLKQRIEVIKDFGNLPDIMCYPGQLNQVFMNVINNALEAIEGEGKLIIRTWQEKGYIKVSIKDTGKGMPEKIKKKIFEPFFTTKEVGKGTGLGLSISFGIIEKHKGRIEVNSEPGKGTEFIMLIPDNLN
ncbi:MAG: PAS domain S-box protein [Bacteroidetes bacterium]|nr:PAS domain S-box protein [Bacteroidota bacterium]